MKNNNGNIDSIILKIEEMGFRDVHNAPTEIKLSELCHSLQVAPVELDDIICENFPVLRTVKGHAFETFIDMSLLGHANISSVGGDSHIDRMINGRSVQIKTPYSRGSSGDYVSFKTNKTHGAKSEKESMDYYQDVDSFAEYLVGLVSYEPLNVLIMKRSELPLHKRCKGEGEIRKIKSPFKIEWRTHPGLNAWHRLGISDINILSFYSESELLPKTSSILNLNTDVVLNTVLSRENFRIWDMAIKGYALEEVFKKKLESQKVSHIDPKNTGRIRKEKSDVVLTEAVTQEEKFFQIKGISLGNCKFDYNEVVLAAETQLTRGRVNDHPTQSRLYRSDDFEFLLLGVNPTISRRAGLGFSWNFYAIPTCDLRTHSKFPSRLNAVQRFKLDDLSGYKISDSWYEKWEKK